MITNLQIDLLQALIIRAVTPVLFSLGQTHAMTPSTFMGTIDGLLVGLKCHRVAINDITGQLDIRYR